MQYQWRLKYFLGKGKYFRHWQLRNASDKKQILYFLPQKISLLLSNCILSNNINIAQKTYSGANRQPCAWVKCEGWTEVEPIEYLGELEPLFYNPKVRPNWHDSAGNNIDNCQYETVITAGNRVYGIGKITQTLFTVEHNSSRPKSKSNDSNLNPLDAPESIADLAGLLTCLDCAEGLKELQQVPEFTSQRLNQAAKALSPDWQKRIRQWAIANHQISRMS